MRIYVDYGHVHLTVSDVEVGLDAYIANPCLCLRAADQRALTMQEQQLHIDTVLACRMLYASLRKPALPYDDVMKMLQPNLLRALTPMAVLQWILRRSSLRPEDASLVVFGFDEVRTASVAAAENVHALLQCAMSKLVVL